MKKLLLALKILLNYKNGYKFLLYKLKLINPERIIFQTRSGFKYITRTNSTDFAILNETVILKEYLKHGFDNLNSNSVVVDLGAQAGDFSTYVAYHFNSKVDAYEPEPGNFNLLKENIELNKLQNKVNAYNLAVTNVDGESKLRLSGWENMGTHSFHYQEGGDFVTVKTVDILKLLEKYRDGIDLLKIDIEGGEHEILIERNKPFFEKALKLVMEYHCQPHVSNSKGLNYLTQFCTDNLGFKLIATHGDDKIGVVYFEK